MSLKRKKNYIIIYQLNEPGQKHKKLEDKLSSYSNSIKCFNTAWLVRTKKGVEEIGNELEKIIAENDDLLILQAGKNKFTSLTDKKANRWVNKNFS